MSEQTNPTPQERTPGQIQDQVQSHLDRIRMVMLDLNSQLRMALKRNEIAMTTIREQQERIAELERR